jgi:tRNA threonylcarbamoyl adenosine modification protein YeaZ/ribosomal-protein-alanine acetyltransferase
VVGAAVTGLSIEAATSHVEVAVMGPDGPLAHLAEDVAHGHTRRVTPMVQAALAEAGLPATALEWVAADLGPGSFTGVRVGIATARAFALAAGARCLGASSLAALAHASPARRALVVPLVEAGRRDVYAGFYRAGARGRVRLAAAPRVVRAEALVEMVAEAHALVPELAVRVVGPGAGRERERLEAAYPSSTAYAFRHNGLSAIDLAHAARLALGPGAGLPAEGRECEPVYVRSAQAEERVRHAHDAAIPLHVRAMDGDDLPRVLEIERAVFSDPWSETFFRSLLARPDTHARVAEREGKLAGYALTVLQPPVAELENLATAPELRRHGIARALLDDALAAGAARGASELTLEVRVSNDAAQALYRGYGFRLAGLRPGYYRQPEEDALLMTRRIAVPETAVR